MTSENEAASSQERGSKPSAKTQFILLGFGHEMGFRVFDFQGIRADRTRAAFTVRTELALARRYGIQLQDLPLLCRAMLERREGDGESALTYAEEDMRIHACACEAARTAAAQKRKFERKSPSANVGVAWRNQRP